MIEEKELRVGNIYATFHKKEIVVTGINTEARAVIGGYFGKENGTEVHSYKDLFPIELTEDKVLELGFVFLEEFEKKRYFQINRQSSYGILYDDQVLCFYYYHEKEGYTVLLCDDIFFKYVHHIQNLYFALTGQELPFA